MEDSFFILIGQIVFYIGIFIIIVFFINWFRDQFKPTTISRKDKNGVRYYLPRLFLWNEAIDSDRFTWLIENKPNWLYKENDKYTAEDVKYINIDWNQNCSC